ncbi:MAG: 50S ribosomal protein L22 [Patescibacteria group bacterium]
MKVQATLKNLRISARKTRLVTRGLVGIDVREALIQLSKQVKKSSGHLEPLLQSAIANATNNYGLAVENLYITDIRVGEAATLKRWLPRAFGRATPLLRRGCHVTIILDEKIEGKDRVAPVKKKAVTVETEPKEGEMKKNTPNKLAQEKIGTAVPTQAAKVTKVFQRKSV